MTTIYCPTPTDQAKVLLHLNPHVTPINKRDMVIVQVKEWTILTHLSDCDEGYQMTAKEYLKQHNINE